MEIVRTIENFNIKDGQPLTSVALGFFDGVHIGHRAVIREAVGIGTKQGMIPTVFTMLQRPKSVLTGEDAGSVITLERKLKIFEELGVEQVWLIDFRDIRHISAEDFARDIICNRMNAGHVVCGFNFHFGSGGIADGDTLRRLCAESRVSVSARERIEFAGLPVSSTRIRESIRNGDITLCNKMLGDRYGFCLPVVHGMKLGRTLGTPTVNQEFPAGLVEPLHGVYASVCMIDGREYTGVTNIGVKPTVSSPGNSKVMIETWFPDYSGDELYGRSLDIRLIRLLRHEIRFPDITALRNQILEDARLAKLPVDT